MLTLVYEYKDGSWKIDVQLNETVIQQKGNSKYYKKGDLEAVEVEIEAAINEKLSKFAPDKSGNSSIAGTTTKPISTEDGGEFAFGEGLTWMEWPATLTDVGVSIYEEAALPDVYWDKNNGKYSTYPLHAPPLLCGVADGVIDEVTSIPQLVKLGCQVVTDKEMALGIWESVKNITPASIKEAATGAIKEKWDTYSSLDFKTWHALGKDGVQVATILSGIGVFSKGGDVTKAVKETGETVKDAIKKKLDDITKFMETPDFKKILGNAWNKYKGKLNKAQWEEKYKTLFKNREVGKLTEEQFELLEGGFKPSKSIYTSDGKRYFDNVLDGTAREVKSGPVTLSKYKDQILKDIEILKRNLTNGNISRIEWHCFDEVDKGAIDTLIKEELKDKANLFVIIKY